MQTIFLIASLQAWLLAFLLAGRRRGQISDRLLALWLFLSGLLVIMAWPTLVPYWVPRTLKTTVWATLYLQGPFLYVYVDILTALRPRYRISYLLHLIPFAAYLFFEIPPRSGPTNILQPIEQAFNVALCLSIPAYCIVALILIARAIRRQRTASSNSDVSGLLRLRGLCLALGTVWACYLAAYLYMMATPWIHPSLRRLVWWSRASILGFYLPNIAFVSALGYWSLLGRQATGRPEVTLAPTWPTERE